MKKIIILTGVVIILLFIGSLLAVVGNASDRIGENTEAMMADISQKISDNPEKAHSSNPYDYIIDNPHYANIVALGFKALTPIRNRIANSKNNGLEEYILAIAAEEIAKVDLKKKNLNWTNGKEWVTEWDKHLRDIPDNIERISSSPASQEEKVEALIELGIPAIPFIMDKVEEGHKEYIPALSKLFEGNKEFSFPMEVESIPEWVTKNKGNFEEIREMIENIQSNK